MVLRPKSLSILLLQTMKTSKCLFSFDRSSLKKKNHRWESFIFSELVMALQYCVGFFHTSTCISHRYTHVPSFLTLPPTSHPIPSNWVVTEHQIWAPWVIQKISTGYLILYMVMYMFHCYSQLILPSTSTYLFYMSVSLLLPCK